MKTLNVLSITALLLFLGVSSLPSAMVGQSREIERDSILDKRVFDETKERLMSTTTHFYSGPDGKGQIDFIYSEVERTSATGTYTEDVVRKVYSNGDREFCDKSLCENLR